MSEQEFFEQLEAEIDEELRNEEEEYRQFDDHMRDEADFENYQRGDKPLK